MGVDGQRFIECNALDRCVDITADPGQLNELVRSIRYPVFSRCMEQTHGSVQIAGSRIVAEALPQLQHVLEVGVGQC